MLEKLDEKLDSCIKSNHVLESENSKLKARILELKCNTESVQKELQKVLSTSSKSELKCAGNNTSNKRSIFI